MLVIIGGFVYWFSCTLLFFLITFIFFYFNNFLKFFILIILFIYLLFLSFFLFSFLPFLLSHVADQVLMLWPGVKLEPLWWENRVQDTGTPETSQPLIISIGESSPR